MIDIYVSIFLIMMICLMCALFVVGFFCKKVPGLFLIISTSICLIAIILVLSKPRNQLKQPPFMSDTTNTISNNIIDHIPTTNDINMVVLPNPELYNKMRYNDPSLSQQILASKKVYQKGYYYLDEDVCMEIRIYKVITTPKQ